MKEYVSLRLVSGQEVIGEVESLVDYITLLNAVEITQAYDERGYNLLKFTPFMTWVEDEVFTFNPKHVIMVCTPTEKLVNYYKQYMDTLKESELEDVFNRYKQRSTKKH